MTATMTAMMTAMSTTAATAASTTTAAAVAQQGAGLETRHFSSLWYGFFFPSFSFYLKFILGPLKTSMAAVAATAAWA